ncbi:MAG: putative bifunctional diguanylate cyclase/phosphodiesterase [Telluria sp.]
MGRTTREWPPGGDSTGPALMHPAELVASPEQWEELLDHLPAGVVVHDAHGHVRALNACACRLLNRSHEELTQAPPTAEYWGFVLADGQPMPAADFPVCQVLSNGKKVEDVIVGVPHPREIRWMICNAYPIRDEDEIRYVVVCFTDCTDLKNAEERLRLALEGATDGAWDWNVATGSAFYSRRWWEMLGEPYGDQHGPIDIFFERLDDDERRRLPAAVRRILAGRDTTYSIEFKLRHRDGHAVPVLSRGLVLRGPDGRALRVTGTNTDLTERKRAEQHLYELAFLDHLTRLPNRRSFVERLGLALERTMRTGSAAALLMLDLDNFKLLNDTLGHVAGDLLLGEVALRLQHAVRGSDQLGRLGGDEFVVLLEDLGQETETAAAEADKVATKIAEVLAEPFQIERHSVCTSCSVGIALFDARTGGVEEVLRQADMAMYQAKTDGRNTARFFNHEIEQAVARRSLLENDLRHALSKDQFLLYCQPQVDAAGAVLGGELLLRWQHPVRGLVPPGEFIALAEAIGLIVPLGRHVLRMGCRLLSQWAAHPQLGRLTLSLNVSVQQLRVPGFADEVGAILRGTGADPQRLCLELTESVFAEDAQAMRETMQAIRALGVQFALDDFGTGYSSLSYLTQLPIGQLKIDRSFVHLAPSDHNAGVLVDTIIAMAAKLGLDVLAEGVETEEQQALLQRCGCAKFQGFLYARPLPLDEFAQRYG